MKKKVALLVVCFGFVASYFAFPIAKQVYIALTRSSADLAEVRSRVEPVLKTELEADGFELGLPTFVRIFKEERELEVWLRKSERFELFRTYEICNFSGDLGPKLKEGDRQSPEGFYTVDKSAMNPNSSYHLSFNLGFPNLFDQANDRSGSFLMVHGDCVSVGCYAMTDQGIEEIYLIVEAAHSSGQDIVPVHAFPFRMNHDRLMLEQNNEWFEYWQNLKQGYDLFEKDHLPPTVTVSGQRYTFATSS